MRNSRGQDLVSTSVGAPDDDRGVYGIPVAAELVGKAAPRLRLYEARGLLSPERTSGGTRRYSANDVSRLHRIADLVAKGVHLTGLPMVGDREGGDRALRGHLDGPAPDPSRD